MDIRSKRWSRGTIILASTVYCLVTCVPAIARGTSLAFSERSSEFGHQIINRKTGSSTFLIGRSASLKSAAQWGNFIFEYTIPQECVYYASNNPLYLGKNESFVPFVIHPEWIRRIRDKSGKILFDFNLKSISDHL